MSSIALLVLVTATARADEVETAAQVHLDRGIAAYGVGDWTLARQELTTASELVPHKPNPYRWLALTEIQLGDCASARLDVDSFIARVPPRDPRIAELERSRDGCTELRVTHDPTPPPAPVPTAAPRLVTRWWFWTLVGGAALAVTGAVLYATSDDGPTILPGVQCDASGCR